MFGNQPTLTPDMCESYIDDDDTFNGAQVDHDGKFDMIVKQSGRKLGTIKVWPSMTVADFKQRIKDQITGTDVDLTPSGLTVDTKKLNCEEYGFPKGHKDANSVELAHEAHGGAQQRRQRRINFQRFRNLKEAPSYAKDCMLKVRIPHEKYAAMKCGCAISAENMYKWMRHIFNRSSAAYVIKCPHHKVEWDWDMCVQVANMGDKEYAVWTQMRDQRRLRDFRACPHCKTLCRKKDGVNIQRVRCGKCRGADWCWTCGQRWNNSGLLICGSSKCTLVQDLTKTLQEAPLIKLSYINAWCPSIRACPRCWTLMKWKSSCKHMKCQGCGKKFCFQCLGLQNSDGSWNCRSASQSSHQYTCKQAPRQNFIK